MPKKSSERFRRVRKQSNTSSERFRNEPNVSEKTPDHILSVREVAKMFENKGVSRTERSIINWCHPNRQGITRLDCYFEENDRKYYITPISVERVIAEEQNKQKIRAEMDSSESPSAVSEKGGDNSESFGKENSDFGSVPNASEGEGTGDLGKRLKELETQKRDLEINNRVKDIYIERLENNQENLMEQLTDKSYKIGELETRLRLLKAPEESPADEAHKPQREENREEVKKSAGGEEAESSKDDSGVESADSNDPAAPDTTTGDENTESTDKPLP